MPKRRRSASKTRRVKRKGPYLKRRRTLRRGRLNTDMHAFTRWAQNGVDPDQACTVTFAPGPALVTAYSPRMKFNNISAHTELTALYDQYMITKIDFNFQLMTNPDSNFALNTTTNSGNNFYPKMWYVKDYDDAGTLTLDAIKQYSKARCLTLMPNKTIRISVRPSVLMEVFNTTLTTQYVPKWKQWCDCENVETPHYGLKVVFDCMSIPTIDTVYPYKVRVDAKYHFTMKCPR